MENKGVCYICGEPLVYEKNDENTFFDGETTIKMITCDNCGAAYHYWKHDDSENELIACNDQGFGKCICGGTVLWSGDFMRSDFEANEDGSCLEEDDDAIVRSLMCSSCGTAIEVYEPTPNEQRSGKYPFWDSIED